ncbi:MAG: hypothetical protein LBS64_06420 [Spirochaetaceae bacterium]|jgi:hypothetical protein|nr:hypothetical protein [Spirochaetaceae bacterium]
MKKTVMRTICALSVTVVCAVSLFGQAQADPPVGRRRQPPQTARPESLDAGLPRPDPVTVNGTLTLKDGFIVLEGGDTFHYVPQLMHYVGFIDGLKEGAQVSVIGYARRNFLWITSFTVGEKTYETPRLGFRGQQGDDDGQRVRPRGWTQNGPGKNFDRRDRYGKSRNGDCYCGRAPRIPRQP